ncbi:methylmalonyl Co-A mutase-associated GTPase MeaB [candidate division KSB1 bacterium]|nr:methylmalonyl Co-A mutase-associated GTPase MeaB [candidate division KSB1 bacterium]NIR70537.1 methylmalonyl Co-A mutase-associated GTPase MeaB [candidate division KSB1 bacterium]NIS26209.1 methylmalonyl Co-A mutase-associated GTPase MeaB [candidate division KSB1 bacterium]NIT72988.1 methylmalonyl Co-A mutase-associated GTPase MeaB [candidate division KSB1 bacterium]NIU26857.1 methylmalonyl Co-A mutase-associated GTPase MeaB [candidate division KSB1 bacterium]
MASSSQNSGLVINLLQGDKRALAKAISLVENDEDSSSDLLNEIYLKLGRGYRIGITGPPGAGKSTLVDQLTKEFRKQRKGVGIVAVDPTSPFTGGALLGDRVRMSEIAMDEGVYIRSMATRGSVGGLSKKADDVADILDAFGNDYIILETVGVGQSELDIAESADTTVVVLVPESGDSVQAMKAGLMEIADLFVLNKADRAGADQAFTEIQSMLELSNKKDWRPPILKSVANQGEGIAEIIETIAEHRDFQSQQNLLEKKRKQRLFKKIKSIVRFRFEQAFWDETAYKTIDETLESYRNLKMSPYKIADELIENFKRKLERKE